MAWSDPATFIAGDILTAAQLNQYVRDNTNYLKGIADGATWSAVHVTRAAAQSVATATNTEMSFDTEALDAGGWWTSGTDITVPAGAFPSGITSIAVHVIMAAAFEADATGFRRLRLLVDGGLEEQRTQNAVTGEQTTVVHPTYLVVSAGEVITMEVHQTSGGNLDVTGGIWVVRHAPVA